jgi:hypothetical protein
MNYQGTSGIVARDKILVTMLRIVNKVFLAKLLRMDLTPFFVVTLRNAHNTLSFFHLQ